MILENNTLVIKFYSAIISDDPYSIKSWSPLWYTCSAVAASGVVIFVAFIKCEEQPWAKVHDKSVEDDTVTVNTIVEE